MTFSNTLPSAFPFPAEVKTLVCCDMDETYIPYAAENKPHGGVAQLETFMLEDGIAKGIVIGWITGTNKNSAIRKAAGYISRSPHFLCCSLGTEFYWIKNGELTPSAGWRQRIIRSGYLHENVSEIVKTISQSGILLKRQPEDYQGPYKISFYYRTGQNMEADFERIKAIAAQFNIRVMFTKCNPAAGDPENCYDVEFIPTCCGKDQAVLFLIGELNLSKKNVLSFGDSANDFTMFANSSKGYLVSNADKNAVEAYGGSLDKPYCHGILSVLKQL